MIDWARPHAHYGCKNAGGDCFLLPVERNENEEHVVLLDSGNPAALIHILHALGRRTPYHDEVIGIVEQHQVYQYDARIKRKLRGVVLSHEDNDHIGGFLAMMILARYHLDVARNPELRVPFGMAHHNSISNKVIHILKCIDLSFGEEKNHEHYSNLLYSKKHDVGAKQTLDTLAKTCFDVLQDIKFVAAALSQQNGYIRQVLFHEADTIAVTAENKFHYLSKSGRSLPASTTRERTDTSLSFYSSEDVKEIFELSNAHIMLSCSVKRVEDNAHDSSSHADPPYTKVLFWSTRSSGGNSFLKTLSRMDTLSKGTFGSHNSCYSGDNCE